MVVENDRAVTYLQLYHAKRVGEKLLSEERESPLLRLVVQMHQFCRICSRANPVDRRGIEIALDASSDGLDSWIVAFDDDFLWKWVQGWPCYQRVSSDPANNALFLFLEKREKRASSERHGHYWHVVCGCRNGEEKTSTPQGAQSRRMGSENKSTN